MVRVGDEKSALEKREDQQARTGTGLSVRYGRTTITFSMAALEDIVEEDRTRESLGEPGERLAT
jgi:hypothetical protein